MPAPTAARHSPGRLGAALLLLVGVALIVAALAPIWSRAGRASWGAEQATAYDRVTTDLHRLAAARDAESIAQREKARAEFDQLHAELLAARATGDRRRLGVGITGALLAAAGATLLARQRTER